MRWTPKSGFPATDQLGATLFACFVLFGTPSCLAQNLSPDQAVQRMQLPAGVTVNCFAAEPMVRQPVAMSFDDRGRLWVIQYLQYPNPAGLKRVAVDRYSRTIYDRVPEPPPHGPRGADRITILTDADGDGRADTAQDFVAGLNLASSIALGYGGVFVLQTPYLLFYADRDGDDVPDGDPEVLLQGFGMQDAHSVANSLTWGPDGWLYGAQGSTVTANIQGHEFQQGIWRYHPRQRKFELFAEGGGNTWGVDFDAHGELIAGTNVGPNAMLHQVQGGYYWKSFGKHGELHNPFAFGYLEHVPYTGFRGGHVTCGGIVYQSNGLPREFWGRYLAANLLSHSLHRHVLEPQGSSFVARDDGDLLVSNDPWFAPVDLCVAPDGAVLVCDWHDERTAHPDPDAAWDRSNGRIYRLQGSIVANSIAPDLRHSEPVQLLELLRSPSSWHRSVARRQLAERSGTLPAPILEQLRERFAKADSPDVALEYLWALATTGGWDEALAQAALSHRFPHVRAWGVRLSVDERKTLSDPLRQQWIALAEKDESAVVRSRLASAAQRLPADVALPIIGGLMRHDEDAADQQLPLLIWWGLETHAGDGAAVAKLFAAPDVWRSRLARTEIAPRLARRLTAVGDEASLSSAATLLNQASAADDSTAQEARQQVLTGIAAGLRGRRFEHPPAPLLALIEREWSAKPQLPAVRELALRTNFAAAIAWARSQLQAPPGDAAAEQQLLSLMALLAEAGHAADYAADCLALSRSNQRGIPLRRAAINALAAWNDLAIARELLQCYTGLPPELCEATIDLLVSRADSAAQLVDAVRAGSIAPAEVSVEQLKRVAQHQQADLDRQILALWGQIREGTPEERLAVVRRLNNDLRAANGNVQHGQRLFREHCGTCHRLFGDGNTIGPDLTTANRQDRDFLLVSLVDPSAQVRKEYLNHVCHTSDGRVLTGLIVEQSPAGVTIVDAKNQKTVIASDQIAELEPAAESLMPSGLLEKLSPDQLRDLFAYLQAAAAPDQAEAPERAAIGSH